PAVFAPHEVSLRLCGGTDVRWAPSIDYVSSVLLRMLRRAGVHAELAVEARGYYPQGGGRVRLSLRPVRVLKGLMIEHRGALLGVRGVAHASRLPGHVVERMSAAACRALESYSPEVELEHRDYASRGAGITLWADFEHSILGACALGEPGKRAEMVGAEAAQELLCEIESGATVDVHLADQLVPFLALARGRSAFLVRELTSHLRTNLHLVRELTGAEVETAEQDGLVRVEIQGIGYENPRIGG
ncbi:MAG: RNA 3'-terminal phosphate cyclase, partial [Euryarchaeota archaeon]|nr:RNA 3'-terminal phosphate cyclase [Euryarchaeota archaeon]